MRTRVWLVVLVALAIACGKEPTMPTPGEPARVIGITISGPTSVPPGQTAAYTATALLSDGSRQDYTTTVIWQAGDSRVLTVSLAGVATALTNGQSTIRAASGSSSATITVVVIPANTFVLSGRVTESGMPVRDAAVTVTSGIGAGLSSTTDDNGRYTLFGVAGPVAIRVTKNGYATVSEPLTADAAGVLDFAITQLGVVDISGTYSMTLTADPACPAEGTQPGALPNELRQRQYVATITQAGATFRATLSGVPFVVSAGRGNGFSGRVEPGQVSFSIGDGYYTPYPDLIESLGPNGVFLVAGFGTIKRSGQDLLGELNGVFIVGQPPIWTNQWQVAECNRPRHRVVLTP